MRIQCGGHELRASGRDEGLYVRLAEARLREPGPRPYQADPSHSQGEHSANEQSVTASHQHLDVCGTDARALFLKTNVGLRQLAVLQGLREVTPGITSNRDHGAHRALGVAYEHTRIGQRALDALASRAIAVRRREPDQVAVVLGLCSAHLVCSFRTELISWAER